MATGEVKYHHLFRIISRELFVGSLLGILVALVGFALATIVRVSSVVAMTVAVTIIAVVI
ncbi:MAG: magnesium transporter, partial [Nitrososphaeria archaeon]|nr:magnesium transporter [Nitrososphaeria archaeon]